MPSKVTQYAVPAVDYTAGPADQAVAAVLDLVGMKTFALEGLLAVSDVAWSREIPSACIETAAHPRLLLNPDFVRARCTTPERMAMLLLHELSHLTLAHTRMVTRVTQSQNIAWDAIINRSLLVTLLNAGAEWERYAELMTACYRPDRAPEFILRPPPEWQTSGRGDFDASAGCPPALRAIHRRLYGRNPKDGGTLDVTYAEIVEALEEARAAGGFDSGGCELLGSHGTTPREMAALTSQAQGNLHERFAGAFESLAVRGGLDGAPGLDEYDDAIALAAHEAAVERTLREAVTRALITGEGRRGSWRELERPALSVLRHRDRRGPAREALARAFGAPRPLFFADSVIERRPTRASAAIYLDVSGSMYRLLPRLFAALAPLRDQLYATLWQFSTEVAPMTGSELHSGRLRTTGGTNIDAVLRHVLSLGDAAPAKALVLTDGYFDAPSSWLAAELRASGRALHVAVVNGKSITRGSEWAASVQEVTLPEPASFSNSSFSSSRSSR